MVEICSVLFELGMKYVCASLPLNNLVSFFWKFEMLVTNCYSWWQHVPSCFSLTHKLSCLCFSPQVFPQGDNSPPSV